MNRRRKSPMGVSLAFLAGLLLCLPLRAQLNPQLQASPTDFLNLFQQASTAQPPPEIVTVFDFSGSMSALMFHPLYVNLDRQDTGNQNNMTFSLSKSGSTYTITASISGTSAGVGNNLNFIALVMPNGTAITQTNLPAVSNTGVLCGDANGIGDIRNWIRAASHARFSYKVSSTVTRTVDIPIPWKITDHTSTGNPLSSMTLTDTQVKLSANGTSTTYGSGLSMEVDLCYQIGVTSSSYKFSTSSWSTSTPSSSSTSTSPSSKPLTSTQLMYGPASASSGMYKAAYIDWLFLSTYGTGQPYAGQYIVYDAVKTGLAGGQTTTTDPNALWGQGYGYGTSSTPSTITAATSNIKVPQFNGSGVYRGSTYDVTSSATVNVVPAYTRCQAVKRAAIQAWIANQANVIWAFRFLDPTSGSTSEGSPSGTTIDNNTTNYPNVTPTTGVPTTQQNGCDSAWTVLNNTSAQGINSKTGNSVIGMQRIATLFPNNGTPLTYAVANALAQFNDPNSVFNAVETGTLAPSACMNHFLIVFTDGVDNNNSSTTNPNATTPYITNLGASNAALSALAGNEYILANQTSIDRSGTYWNLFTFAGVAAHLTDTNLGTTSTTPGPWGHMAATQQASNTSAVPHTFLPFAIQKRGSTSFGTYGHRVTTMTVGVSLGGYFNDASSITSSPKRNLFVAAVAGDPSVTTGNFSSTPAAASDFHPFVAPVKDASGNWTYNDWWINPADPPDYPTPGLRAPGAVYFFDGSDPEILATDLQYALIAATSAPNINSTVPPNLPYTGTSFSNEIYLAKFVPSSSQGVLWSGDLLAFSTKTTNNQEVILDTTGNVATVFDSTTAVWSAQAVLSNTASFPWTGRKLFTRIPGTASVPEPGFSTFTYTGMPFTDATVGLTNFVGRDINTHSVALSTTQQQAVIQLVSGADLTGPVNSSGVPTNNRANIMGDIINSSPTTLQYLYSDVKSLLPASLSGAGNTFRLILTGTNQGWLHAFGEVSTQTTQVDSTGATQTIVTGKVQELWAFLPTDFLADLDYLNTPNNIHRFMVDGAPSIYFLDLPTPGGGAGDGVVDISTAPGPERAVAIFGLGKGGRSYYAIDIHNPVSPALLWSIRPDESAVFPASRIPTGGPSATTVRTVLSNMGFSTCAPALGRVMFNGVLRDVVFFGGGYSNTSVEHNFPTYPNPPSNQQTPLGRSVLAVDVYTGQVLAAVDLSPANHSTPAIASGPIAAGVVPFEFFLNSGMAQRAYFLDFAGGLWCWGSKETATAAPYIGYRMDTSDLAYWTTDSGTGGATRSFSTGSNAGIRKVSQDGSGSSALYSTLPAPFVVGSFPGVGKASGAASPAAVGVAMISGDRNNPLDYNYSSSNPAPTDHRLTVVFDRQDSRDWNFDTAAGPDTGIIDSQLLSTLTAAAVNPQDLSYYLDPTTAAGTPIPANTKFGYFIGLPIPSGGFIPKGINTPSVVAGSLFYSYFTPTSADACTGGSGTTYTNLLCSVLNPLLVDATTNACQSGQATSWVGVASNLTTYGTTGVIQAGAVAVANPAPGASQTTLSLVTLLGQQQQRYPKIRTWRTIH